MTKYYLFLLLGIFIFMNGVDYFNRKVKYTLKQTELLKYKIKKQKLYNSHIKEIQKILSQQNIIFKENQSLFFSENKKETIVFSEIQQYIQDIFKNIGGKITLLNSGIVIKNKFYKKYPITLSFDIIPEDLDVFFKKLNQTEKYLFIDSLHIFGNKRENLLNVKITLIGYQL